MAASGSLRPARLPRLLLFLALWIPSTALTLPYLESRQLDDHDILRRAKKVRATIETASFDSKGNLYTIQVRIPPTFGISQCTARIGPGEYHARVANEVNVYVMPGSRFTCWTGGMLESGANRSFGRRLGLAVLQGGILAGLIYVLAMRIRFGPSRRSLSERWTS